MLQLFQKGSFFFIEREGEDRKIAYQAREEDERKTLASLLLGERQLSRVRRRTKNLRRNALLCHVCAGNALFVMFIYCFGTLVSLVWKGFLVLILMQ